MQEKLCPDVDRVFFIHSLCLYYTYFHMSHFFFFFTTVYIGFSSRNYINVRGRSLYNIKLLLSCAEHGSTLTDSRTKKILPREAEAHITSRE